MSEPDLDCEGLPHNVVGTLRCVPSEQLNRLLKVVMAIVDRHAEGKEGSRLLYLPVMPREMKELRAAIKPFRKGAEE